MRRDTLVTRRLSITLACGVIASALTTTDTSSTEAQTAPATAPSPSVAYLVWQETDDGPLTELVDPTGAVVARGRRLLVSTAAGLRAIERRRRTVTLATCAEILREEGEPDAPASPHAIAELTQLVLRDVSTGAESVLVPEANSRDVADLEQEVVLTAGLGDQLFVRHRVWEYGCGAHGEAEVRALSFALDRAAATPPTLVAGDPARAAADLLAALRAERGADADGESIAAGDVGLVESLPLVRAGRLLVRSRYTAGVAYVFTDGTWSSYERSAVVDVSRPPAAWSRLAASFPAAVLARLDREGVGLSVVRGDAVARARSALAPR